MPERRRCHIINIRRPINVTSRDFIENKYDYYKQLREHAPVHRGRLGIFKAFLIARYDDCVNLLKDPRFVRNRTTVTGGRRSPFPLPKSIALLGQSMITEDDPGHRRLRGLVQLAFTPRAIEQLTGRVERLTHELLDRIDPRTPIDLMQAYCLPIPMTVISEMVGVADCDMPMFRNSMHTLSNGLTGWNIFRTLVWNLPRTVRFVRELIQRKRADPQDDILTALIHAEERGDRLTEDELVSMVFLLVMAGYETTVHMITNSIVTLLQHPPQLERLRAEPALMESAVEEILRYRGPIHGTKPNYATQDVTLHGVTIPKGAIAMPLLGSANHDPAVFDLPEVFDIARTPNRHLAFGYGKHFCLGAQLARMETRIALTTLLERAPTLRLAVPPQQLKLVNFPLWHRYAALPIVLG